MFTAKFDRLDTAWSATPQPSPRAPRCSMERRSHTRPVSLWRPCPAGFTIADAQVSSPDPAQDQALGQLSLTASWRVSLRRRHNVAGIGGPAPLTHPEDSCHPATTARAET